MIHRPRFFRREPGSSLRDRVLSLLARWLAPVHKTNASGNNMSQR